MTLARRAERADRAVLRARADRLGVYDRRRPRRLRKALARQPGPVRSWVAVILRRMLGMGKLPSLSINYKTAIPEAVLSTIPAGRRSSPSRGSGCCARSGFPLRGGHRPAVLAAGDPAQSHSWLNCETSNVSWSIAFNG
ncbi:hypothetical protein BZL30_4912 [Mycobacterium kansasii]|uniref:Uncharacterized protein n=1 Tax=Mycobacterium kansasii TaxID=1768 RepID=A0A1V3X4X5_MYCKA|nr:hypothetical protein BZL30_4912 [Mycobacterium kansasii]